MEITPPSLSQRGVLVERTSEQGVLPPFKSDPPPHPSPGVKHMRRAGRDTVRNPPGYIQKWVVRENLETGLGGGQAH